MCNKYLKSYYCILFFVVCLFRGSPCDALHGPDPWDFEDSRPVVDDVNIPPDLKILPKRQTQAESTLGYGEWFFKRILGIVLRGGQVKKNEERDVCVSLQMKFNEKEWELLDEYLKSTDALSEDMFRRSVGYVEQAIYNPTITEQIAVAWSDYIQTHLTTYKYEISCFLGVLGAVGVVVWLKHHMSNRHLFIALVASLYLYEVFTSYKEAEQKELDRFMSAIDSCKWMIWSSTCDVPRPDPLIFIKHMNPLKIGIRMFTTAVSEPLITLSDVLKIMVHGITDGLWFPFDKILYGILLVTFNVLLLFLLISVLFNYILNIPFNLNFLGIVSLGLKQRNRNTLGHRIRRNEPSTPELSDSRRRPRTPDDRISGTTLNRLLDMCSKAITAAQSNNTPSGPSETATFTLKRSASTGRLPDLNKLVENNSKALTHWQGHDRRNAKSAFGNLKKRDAHKPRGLDGSGDAN